MEWILVVVGLIMLIGVIIYAYNLGLTQQLKNSGNVEEVKLYVKRQFMTQTELNFYEKIRDLEIEYRIVPQVNLATIVKKVNKGYFNELFKNIDFAIFDKEYKELLLLIELNDSTHDKKDRKDRDSKVKNICKNADIKLITFYIKYPNEKSYVLNRIKQELFSVNKKNEN